MEKDLPYRRIVCNTAVFRLKPKQCSWSAWHALSLTSAARNKPDRECVCINTQIRLALLHFSLIKACKSSGVIGSAPLK